MKKIEGKHKRVVLKNFDDALKEKNEPYSSILKILFVASNFDKTFKLMQTKELRELIVRRYHISPKQQDKNRYAVLLQLKKELNKEKYSDIHTNQDIEPLKNLIETTSDDYKRFESYLNRLEKKGLIERPTRGYCRISTKFMFEPFKKWCSNFINECPIDKSATWWNSILFFPNISIEEFEDDEVIELKGLLHQARNCYSDVNDFLGKVGYRKANYIWQQFLDDADISDVTKFYFWLKLIEFHYLTEFRPIFHMKRVQHKREVSGMKLNDIKISIDLFKTLRYEDWVEKFATSEKFAWDDSFRDIVYEAFVKFVKIKYSNLDIKKVKKQFDNDLNRYNTKFDEIKNRSLVEMAKIGYAMMILIPDFIRHQALEKLGMPQNDAMNIDKAIRYMYNQHPYIEKFWSATGKTIEKQGKEFLNIKDKEMELLSNKIFDESTIAGKAVKLFDKYCNEIREKEKIDKEKKSITILEKIDFFQDFESNLKDLGYTSRHELYEELRDFANFYSCPITDSSS